MKPIMETEIQARARLQAATGADPLHRTGQPATEVQARAGAAVDGIYYPPMTLTELEAIAANPPPNAPWVKGNGWSWLITWGVMAISIGILLAVLQHHTP